MTAQERISKLQMLMEQHQALRTKEGGFRVYEHDFVRVLIREAPYLLDVIEAALAIRGRWEGALCITEPPCCACDACRFDRALAALDRE
jgi:hypothetical protein